MFKERVAATVELKDWLSPLGAEELEPKNWLSPLGAEGLALPSCSLRLKLEKTDSYSSRELKNWLSVNY